MQLDPGAVTQIARTYHGYYRVYPGRGNSEQVLRYDNDFQEEGGSSLEINCAEGTIVIRLRTPHRGRQEVERSNADYNTLHQVFKDPRCFFLPAIVKPKRRSSRELSSEDRFGEDKSGPLVFTLSAYKNTAQQVPVNGIIGPGLVPGGGQDLGAPVCGGLFGPSPRVPADHSGPRVPADLNCPRVPADLNCPRVPADLNCPRVPADLNCPKVPADLNSHTGPDVQSASANLQAPGHQVKADTLAVVLEPADINTESRVNVPVEEHVPHTGGEKVYGPAKPDPALLPPEAVDHDLQTLDHLYRTKTRTELNYLKRKQQLDSDRIKKKAVFSHKDKIEGYNSYLGSLTEFNEQRKINWSKH
eukprot:GFUD01027146.1.p1 GENE.GFUD01027146.1~~GFUD01027146.1.p1  ORF type:complete len:359 (-),score=117.96 GFUD01027146.1:180-1256(-)